MSSRFIYSFDPLILEQFVDEQVTPKEILEDSSGESKSEQEVDENTKEFIIWKEHQHNPKGQECWDKIDFFRAPFLIQIIKIEDENSKRLRGWKFLNGGILWKSRKHPSKYKIVFKNLEAGEVVKEIEKKARKVLTDRQFYIFQKMKEGKDFRQIYDEFLLRYYFRSKKEGEITESIFENLLVKIKEKIRDSFKEKLPYNFLKRKGGMK